MMPSNHLIFVVLFSSCLQSFPASRSFPMSWLFSSGSRSVEASALASVLPMSIQGRYPIGLTGLKTLKSLLYRHSSKASFLGCSAFFMVQFSHTYMTTGKTMALTIWAFIGKVMSLLLYTLSRFVIAFLPRSKHLLLLWLQSPSTVILEPKKRKSVTISIFPPSICHKVMGPDARILVFWMLDLNPGFSLSSFTISQSL